MMPTDEGKPVYSIYGDPAYPQSAYIFGGFRGAREGSIEQEFNTAMSSVCETIKWGFKDIINQFAFLDIKVAMKIFKMPLAQYYMVGRFFQNIRVCFYGNETSNFFDAIPMSIDQYLSLIKTEDEIEDEIEEDIEASSET
jgi:nuclease HARBI1